MSCAITVYTKNALPQYVEELLLAKLGEACKHLVQRRYGAESIKEADIIIVSWITQRISNTRTKTELCGFALLKFKSNTKIELTLICSNKKQGKRILQEAENQGHSFKIPVIELHALPSAIKFYEKQGYKEVNNACIRGARRFKDGDDTNGWRMTKCLNLAGGGTCQSRKTRSRTSRSRKTRSRKSRSVKRCRAK